MGRDVKRLKRLIDLIDRPEGATMSELQESYGGKNGGKSDKSTVERVLRYLRETLKLTISTRGYRYFLERNESFQLFNTAAATSAIADLLNVEPGKDAIIDLGAFKIGKDITCLNEVVEGLKSNRELRIHYKKLRGGAREWRTIRPMFLRWYASQWYLFARDNQYSIIEAPRAFRLDGIEEVEFGESFNPRKEDLPTFFAQKFIGVSGDDSKAVEITLHIDQFGASWLESTLDLEKFNYSKRAMGNPANWWEIKLAIDPNPEFFELLMRLQAEFKIVAPNEVRESFRARINKLLRSID